MPLVRTPAAALLPLLLAAAAAPPMPELKIEATDGGSALVIRNGSAQPLTAYLIEMVGYPGSSYSLYQEEIGRQPLAAGGERRVAISNMTVGAVPEYVKMQAAIFGDGSSAGAPGKVAQLIGLRRTTLETTRELIARLDKGKGGGRAGAIAELRAWDGSIAEPAKRDRGTPAALTRSTTHDLIRATAARLERGSVEDILTALVTSEHALASGKPAL